MFSPGFGRGFSLSRVVRHRSGFLLLSSSSGLVAVFCQSSLAARSVVLWRWGVRSSVFTLFPPVVRGTLVLTGWSRHCRITAGLVFHGRASAGLLVESQRWGCCSWSPGRLCLFTPFLVEICRFGAISPGVVGFSSSSVCQFTVGRGGTFPRGTWSEFP